MADAAGAATGGAEAGKASQGDAGKTMELKRDELKQQQVIHRIEAEFKARKEELGRISQKVSSLEEDKNGHSLVIDTLAKLDGTRTCFRMVGGVLTERTVSEVLPAVTTNRDNMVGLIDSLETLYKKKDSELNEFMSKFGIKPNQGGGYRLDPDAVDVDQAKGLLV